MKSESPAGNSKHIYTKSLFAYSTIVINFHQHKFNNHKNFLNLKNEKRMLKIKHDKYWLNHIEIE
jgi:hypothetical protein